MASESSGVFNNSPKKYIEERPWGKFERLTLNETTTVKIITVNPGEELSVQKHKHRSEFWRVLSGQGMVLIGSDEFATKSGDEFYISVGVLHSMKAGVDGISFLEIAYGDFDESDIERISDKYERAKNT